MIRKITLLVNHEKRELASFGFNEQGIGDIHLNFHKKSRLNFLALEIEFSESPRFYRDSSYKWSHTNQICISDPLSPKILKFSSGDFLMANKYFGTWIYNPKIPNQLSWILISKGTSPSFYFDDERERIWVNPELDTKILPELKLILTKNPVEVSRSKIPFSPVIIFTDHCDFDSDTLLESQRKFFKKHSIKTTKGLFLNHYSHKGDWNSSYDKNPKEYLKWKEDGHELCIHSITQSIIPEKEKLIFSEFRIPEILKINTWIDHGYQPYNWSLQKDVDQRVFFLDQIKSRGIELIWNYYDVSEASWNLNQLNSNLNSFQKIFSSGISLKEKLRIAVFYRGSEKTVKRYRKVAGNIKKGKVLEVFKILPGLLSRIKLDEMIKRVQVFFHVIDNDVTFFQSIVVKDWVVAFGTPLENLVKEKGVAILHTYFSFMGKHHVNKMFLSENGNIDPLVDQAFSRLSKLISKNEIWNPTLVEFKKHVEEVSSIDLSDFYSNRYSRVQLFLDKKIIRYVGKD